MTELGTGLSTWMIIGGTALFLLIVIVASYVGVSATSRTNSLEEYLVSGRRLPWALTTAVLVSAWIYTSSTMGSAESGFIFGGSGLWMYSMYGLSLFAVALIIPRFKFLSDRFGFDSLAEFIRLRMDKKTYYMATLIIFIGSALTTLLNIDGAGFVIEALSQGRVPFWFGVAVVSGMTLVYVLWGGYWSTATTAWVLALIATIGVAANIPFIINGAGGLGSVASMARNAAEAANTPEMASLYSPSAAKVFLLATVLYGLSGMAVQEWYQPGIASKQGGRLRLSYLIAFFWVVVVTSVSGALGFLGWALTQGGVISEPGSASEILPHLSSLFAPWWVQFLMLFLVFGAGSGTVAITLMSQGTMLTDLLGRGKQATDKSGIMRARVYMVAAVVVMSVFCVIVKPGVLYMVLLSTVVFAPLGVNMALAILWTRVNRNGMFLGALIGLIVALYLFFTTSAGTATLWGTVVGTGISFIWTLVQPGQYDFNDMRGDRETSVR
ncbi:MAG: sodium:solute symporter family protein [Thermoleophilia bacterium]